MSPASVSVSSTPTWASLRPRLTRQKTRMTDSAPYAKSRVNRETNRSTPSLGNVRSEAGIRSLIDSELANGSLHPLLPSRAQQLAISNCLVDDHPRDRLAIHFLFRCV